MVYLFQTSITKDLMPQDVAKLRFFPEDFVNKWLAVSNEKQRQQTLHSKVLLVDALKYLSKDCAVLQTYQVNELGKPSASGVFFSISHCANTVVVAVADGELGVDIQGKITKKDEVLARVCSEEEICFFSQNKVALWTRKEAVVKLFGDSILNAKKYDVQKDEAESCFLKTFSLHENMTCSVAMKQAFLMEKVG